jgi:hypothetical protein
MMGVVRYDGRGVDMRELDLVSVDGCACKRRCERVIHRWEGIWATLERFARSGDIVRQLVTCGVMMCRSKRKAGH